MKEMALLGIIKKFNAYHGSREIRTDEFTVEMILNGEISNGFVGGIDYVRPKKKLENVVSVLNGQYLDDIVGRATNENIATYFIYELHDVPIDSLKVYEGNEQYAQVFSSEFSVEKYPAQLCFNKAQSLLFREMPEAAINKLDEAICLKEDFSEAYNLRGRCYKYLNKYDIALSDYLKAIELSPKFGEAYRNLGNAYYYLDLDNLMIPAFTKAIELLANSAIAYNNRGYAYQKLKIFDLALMDHNKAIELDPNYAEAYKDRADAHAALGNEELAEKDRLKLNELISSKTDTYYGIIMY